MKWQLFVYVSVICATSSANHEKQSQAKELKEKVPEIPFILNQILESISDNPSKSSDSFDSRKEKSIFSQLFDSDSVQSQQPSETHKQNEANPSILNKLLNFQNFKSDTESKSSDEKEIESEYPPNPSFQSFTSKPEPPQKQQGSVSENNVNPMVLKDSFVPKSDKPSLLEEFFKPDIASESNSEDNRIKTGNQNLLTNLLRGGSTYQEISSREKYQSSHNDHRAETESKKEEDAHKSYSQAPLQDTTNQNSWRTRNCWNECMNDVCVETCLSMPTQKSALRSQLDEMAPFFIKLILDSLASGLKTAVNEMEYQSTKLKIKSK